MAVAKLNREFLPPVGFVREPVVLAHVGVGRTRWREMIKAGEAPAPQRWSSRVSVYNAAQIHAWIEARASNRPWVAPQEGAAA